MTNELKTWPTYFDWIWRRVKTFDVRRDDRHFTHGDRYTLREWEYDGQGEGHYTGREIDIVITYVMRCSRKNPALTFGYCVFSFTEVARRG